MTWDREVLSNLMSPFAAGFTISGGENRSFLVGGQFNMGSI